MNGPISSQPNEVYRQILDKLGTTELITLLGNGDFYKGMKERSAIFDLIDEYTEKRIAKLLDFYK